MQPAAKNSPLSSSPSSGPNATPPFTSTSKNRTETSTDARNQKSSTAFKKYLLPFPETTPVIAWPHHKPQKADVVIQNRQIFVIEGTILIGYDIETAKKIFSLHIKYPQEKDFKSHKYTIYAVHNDVAILDFSALNKPYCSLVAINYATKHILWNAPKEKYLFPGGIYLSNMPAKGRKNQGNSDQVEGAQLATPRIACEEHIQLSLTKNKPLQIADSQPSKTKYWNKGLSAAQAGTNIAPSPVIFTMCHRSPTDYTIYLRACDSGKILCTYDLPDSQSPMYCDHYKNGSMVLLTRFDIPTKQHSYILLLKHGNTFVPRSFLENVLAFDTENGRLLVTVAENDLVNVCLLSNEDKGVNNAKEESDREINLKETLFKVPHASSYLGRLSKDYVAIQLGSTTKFALIDIKENQQLLICSDEAIPDGAVSNFFLNNDALVLQVDRPQHKTQYLIYHFWTVESDGSKKRSDGSASLIYNSPGTFLGFEGNFLLFHEDGSKKIVCYDILAGNELDLQGLEIKNTNSVAYKSGLFIYEEQTSEVVDRHSLCVRYQPRTEKASMLEGIFSKLKLSHRPKNNNSANG